MRVGCSTSSKRVARYLGPALQVEPNLPRDRLDSNNSTTGHRRCNGRYKEVNARDCTLPIVPITGRYILPVTLLASILEGSFIKQRFSLEIDGTRGAMELGSKENVR